MKYSDIYKSVLAQLVATNQVVPYISGKPGGGKSSCARDIAKALAEKFDIPDERIVEFNPSLREPADVLGLPQFNGDHTKWLPPEEFYRLRDGVGPCVLIVEELSDADMGMQNPLCRVILDRYAGQLKLSDQLFIIATGNRTQDKSGANRLSTKLANRMRELEFTEDLDDWLDWAGSHGVPVELQAFIRYRPVLLSDFDPKRTKNPTPRSWESVGLIPKEIRDDPALFLEHASGSVGEGAASEYVGFLRIMDRLPDIDKIIKSPLNAPVPEGRDVIWATVAKLSTMLTARSAEAVWLFTERLGPETAVAAAKMYLSANKKVIQSAKTKDGKMLYGGIMAPFLMNCGLL